MKPEIEKALTNWIAISQEIIENRFNRSFPNLEIPVLSYTEGRKYCRIILDRSVFGFINKETGDVLKAASWKAPAKTARGNLFDDNNGTGRVSFTGVY